MQFDEIIRTVYDAGGQLWLEGDKVHARLPEKLRPLVPTIREHKPELIDLLKKRGGRLAAFPHCPACASYALYRKDNIGAYECLTCGLLEIEEGTARRLV